MNSSKIVIVVDWQLPTMVHVVRNFMGLADYYRRFVEGFSKLLSYLTTLNRKNIKFIWNNKY